MSDQTDRILNKISEGEKVIEIHTSHFKNFEKNIERNKKFCQRNVDENKDLTIQ